MSKTDLETGSDTLAEDNVDNNSLGEHNSVDNVDNNNNNNNNDIEKSSLDRKDSNASVGFGVAPDGGSEAWLVALGCACIMFSSLGFANSFGIFQEYYMTHQLRDSSADTIAWIGSCTAFFQFLAGLVAGPMFDRYGAKFIPGAAIICVFAVMMTSLCHEFYQFLLAQGILLGLASGAMQMPAFAAVSQYFDKKRAAALGLAIAGSSIGGVVFPLALSRMLNTPHVFRRLGFGWSVRILGFVMLAALIVACFTIKARLPPRKTSFFLVSAFRQLDFVFLVLAMFLLFFGLFTPLFFLPAYAVSCGVQSTLAADLLAIANAASTFGRIIPGILADKLGRINALVVGGITCGISIMCMTKATSVAGLVVYAVFFGFISGCIISGGSAAITVCVRDPRNMGTYMGQSMGVASIAVLIGPPIFGNLLHHHNSYLPSTLLAGIACIVGGFVALVAKVFTPAGLFGRT